MALQLTDHCFTRRHIWDVPDGGAVSKSMANPSSTLVAEPIPEETGHSRDSSVGFWTIYLCQAYIRILVTNGLQNCKLQRRHAFSPVLNTSAALFKSEFGDGMRLVVSCHRKMHFRRISMKIFMGR
jgi:hypothetical protein